MNLTQKMPQFYDILQDKDLLIFDFDGTVADTTPLHEAAFSQVLVPMGVIVDYSTIAGMKTIDAMIQCLTNAGKNVTKDELELLVTAKQHCVRTMIARDLQPLAGVDDFLRWARSRYRLAMYTSGSYGTVSLALDKLGYTGWFEPLLCADDVQCAKPDPEGYLQVLQITGVSAKASLVFEDSHAGFKAAEAANISFIDVRQNPWKILIGGTH